MSTRASSFGPFRCLTFRFRLVTLIMIFEVLTVAAGTTCTKLKPLLDDGSLKSISITCSACVAAARRLEILLSPPSVSNALSTELCEAVTIPGYSTDTNDLAGVGKGRDGADPAPAMVSHVFDVLTGSRMRAV